MGRPDFSGLFLLRAALFAVALEKARPDDNIGFNGAPGPKLGNGAFIECRCCCVNQRLTKAADPEPESSVELFDALWSIRPFERFDHGCTGIDAKTDRKVGLARPFCFYGMRRRRASGTFSFLHYFEASASRMRTQERMPLWKDCRSYFSFGE